MWCADIGANLLDKMYQGEYNGKQAHEPDLDRVLQRAWDSGVEKIIITAGTLQEAQDALALSERDSRLFCTVGVHPTRCGEFDAHPQGPEAYLDELRQVRLAAHALPSSRRKGLRVYPSNVCTPAGHQGWPGEWEGGRCGGVRPRL